WADPGHGHTGPLGGQAHGLSGHSRPQGAGRAEPDVSAPTRLAGWLWRHAFVRFSAIGGVGYLLAIALLGFFTGVLKLDFAAANALTIFLTMAFTWLGNRYFTFRDRHARGFSAVLQEWLKFMGANGLGALVNYL